MSEKRILITGAAGYVGRQLMERLSAEFPVFGVDIRPAENNPQLRLLDVRAPGLAALLREWRISHVVHLASVLAPSADRARDYDIDVNGTRNVLQSCVAAGVRHVCYTSSGAAYGYHADNPAWIDETDALRGNAEFSYSDHKRQIEEMLADFRQHHPELQQLIFRPGTILGAHTNNLITQLFQKPRLLAVSGSSSPFVFIWDQDVISALQQGLQTDAVGIFNMAGDGALTIEQIAAILGKPVRHLPAGLIAAALRLGRALQLTRYGPEQVNFLRYRPVLSNRRLKEEFGYQPAKTSEETFRFYAQHALGIKQ